SARPPVRWPATLLPGRWWQQRPQSGGQGGSAGPTAPWRVLPGDAATAPELLGESWGTGTSPQGTGYAKPPPPGTATRPRPSQTAHLGPVRVSGHRPPSPARGAAWTAGPVGVAALETAGAVASQPLVARRGTQSRTWRLSCQFAQPSRVGDASADPSRRLSACWRSPHNLALCRSIQLLVLLARGDAAKDLELLVLRHQLACSAAKSHVPGSSLPPALLAAFSRAPSGSRWSGFLVSPRRCAGTAALSRSRGPTPTTQQGDRSSTRSCSSGSFGWPARTRA